MHRNTTKNRGWMAAGLIAALAGLLLPSLADAADFTVKASDLKLQAGTRGVTPVIISTTGTWHLNGEAPLTLKLNAADGLTLAKSKLDRADLAVSTRDEARFDVALSATGAPGKRELEGEATFVLCQDQACRPMKAQVRVPVEIVPAGPPPVTKASATNAAKKKTRARKQ